MGYLIKNRGLPENHPFFTSKLKPRTIETRSEADHVAVLKNAEAEDSDEESE